jgi:O-succinylbenzoic acid--CoA ligase
MRELSIVAAAREEPSRDCLIEAGRVWSYDEVAVRVRSAIHALRERGIEEGQRVAFSPEADLSSAVWLFALFELGCPVVLLHPRLTEREREAVLAEAYAVHTLAGPAPEGGPAGDPVDRIPAEYTLAIVFTSGSRGTPRGARLSRKAFVASARAHASNLGWREDDRWLAAMPLAHVGGLSILTRCLIARRCAVLHPTGFDPVSITGVMEREGVTLLSVVPTMLHRLLAIEPPWTPGPLLRAVLVGGAPFPDALRAEAVKRGVPALATYGCTEACSQISTQTREQVGRPGAGAPLRGIQVRIEGGEIQVSGDVLMDGYLGGDHSEPCWTSDGWFRTGDSGVFAADGQLVVQGRQDDLVVTGGENVAPQEIEAWLQTVPGVASACVFGVPHQEWGREVVAAIVPEEPVFDRDVLRARMRAELAGHKRPKRIALLEAMPLNRSGKVDRTEVARRSAPKLRRI